jgi:voltage-gated potassium channel
VFEFFRAWRGLKVPVYLIFGSLFVGALGYKLIYPDVEFLRLLYMTGITLTTVGYGDILGIDGNPYAIVYTLILMIAGMGVVLYSTSLVTAFIIEGNLKDAFSLERLRRRIQGMNDHYIICGAGESGTHVIREMLASEQKFVVIESSKDKRDNLLSKFSGINILLGDATSDSMLEKAGVDKAKGLIAALSNDKDNLYLTMSAKILHPNLTIVAKAIEVGMSEKLKRAGASKVVSANLIGGMRMASELLRPNVTSFLDKLLSGNDVTLRVEECVIPSDSHIIGMTLKEVDFYGQCGVNVLGLARSNEEYLYNPDPKTILRREDVLLYIGSLKQEEQVDQFVSRN